MCDYCEKRKEIKSCNFAGSAKMINGDRISVIKEAADKVANEKFKENLEV